MMFFKTNRVPYNHPRGQNLGINKRSEFGLRTGTKVSKTVFYKGTFRAHAGTIVNSCNFLVVFGP